MKIEEMNFEKKARPSFLPVLLAVLIPPVSLVLFIFNYFFPFVGKNRHPEWERDGVSPLRWFLAVSLPIFVAARGLKKRSLDRSGALLAGVMGFFLTLSNYCFMVTVLTFFFSSSTATKFRARRKMKIEEDFKEGGQRNWKQVLCNGGMITQIAILYLMDIGHGERTINFNGDYRASWLCTAALGAISCANGDTWASELGSVVGKFQPRHVLTLKSVPRGTNGGVTIGGLIFSFLGGLLIGIAYYLTLLATVDSVTLERSPPQFPVILLGGAGGFFGSLIDSVIGGTLQYSGTDSSGKIFEEPGPNITKICGLCILDNHSVNLVSTILTSFLIPKIAIYYWHWSYNA